MMNQMCTGNINTVIIWELQHNVLLVYYCIYQWWHRDTIPGLGRGLVEHFFSYMVEPSLS